jgi:NADH-quinone oxidoreductase subunit N
VIEANLIDVSMIMPELVLAIGAMALLMFGVYSGERSAPAVTAASVAVLGVAVLAVALGGEDATTLGGAFVVDGFARFMKIAALIGSAVAIIMSWRFSRSEGSSASSSRSSSCSARSACW